MKLVPLKNETVKVKCESFSNEIVFPIKILNIVEGIRFKELAMKTVTCKPEDTESIYQQVIELGVDIEGITGFDGDEIALPAYVYEWLVNQVTLHNTVSKLNVKK